MVQRRGGAGFSLQTLQSQGYRVLHAPNADTAIALCRTHPGTIHLLLTDLVMPGMGGHELAQRVGALRPSIKILYMSGYTDDAAVLHAIKTAHAPFVQKPFSPEHLRRLVRETLDAPALR